VRSWHYKSGRGFGRLARPVVWTPDGDSEFLGALGGKGYRLQAQGIQLTQTKTRRKNRPVPQFFRNLLASAYVPGLYCLGCELGQAVFGLRDLISLMGGRCWGCYCSQAHSFWDSYFVRMKKLAVGSCSVNRHIYFSTGCSSLCHALLGTSARSSGIGAPWIECILPAH